MRQDYLVSVIVTTYNRPNELKICLDRIVKQSYDNLEIIVVDQMSIANIDEYLIDKRISFYQNDDGTKLISSNRNFGLSKATGEFVAFCDDDDFWHHDKIEKQMKLATEINRDLVVVHSNAVVRRTNGMYLRELRSRRIDGFGDFIRENPIIHSSVLVKNTSDLDFTMMPIFRASEDFEQWLRLLSKGYKFIHINESLLTYTYSEASASRTSKKRSDIRFVAILLIYMLEMNVVNRKFVFTLASRLILKLLRW